MRGQDADEQERDGLSLYTIETHRSNIFQKLNLHSSAELIL